jgi:hypothetical protein
MPTFQGQVTEDAIVQLIAYIKSLGGAPGEKTATAKSPEEKPTEPQPTEGGHAAAPATEGTPAVVAPPADPGQPDAGTNTPTNPQAEPPTEGKSSSGDEQTM